MKKAQWCYATHAETSGNVSPPAIHTMVGLKRLNNVHDCLDKIHSDNIVGDCIETGVWRGGVCIFIRGFLKAHNCNHRTVWLADSFEGLPQLTARDISDKVFSHVENRGIQQANSSSISEILKARNRELKSFNDRVTAVSQADVKENFRRYDLLDEQVQFLPGWFCDTLPNAPIKEIALLRLDGDFYDSTTDALENLYHKVSAGGFVIIDDFAIPPCRRAVEDFRNKYQISEYIKRIDNTGVYWRKQS